MAYLNETGLRQLVTSVRGKVIAITGEIQTSLNNHINNTNNPHSVTATQVNAAPLYLVPITKTSSFQIALTDIERPILCSSGSVINCTVPNNSTLNIPTGAQITLTQSSTGTVTIVPASGVTINSKDGKLSIDGQYAAVTLLKTNTNEWYLWGALA